MDVEQLREDVAQGTVHVDRLVDLIVSQQKLVQQQQKQLAAESTDRHADGDVLWRSQRRPDASADPGQGDYRRLINEIMRLSLANELFLFVTTDGVDGNNNASKRELRDDAQRRVTGRTNKTANGAKRQTIIASVLRTLGKQLSKFTLESVITEVQRWSDCGRSCFTEQAEAADLSRAPPESDGGSLLSRIILEVDKPQVAEA